MQALGPGTREENQNKNTEDHNMMMEKGGKYKEY